MRRESERSTFNVKDLQDQAPARAVLVFRSVPAGPYDSVSVNMVRVDAIEALPSSIHGYRDGQVTPVVSFSPDHSWKLFDAGLLEVVDMEVYLETERANIHDREQTKRALQATYEAAIRPPSPQSDIEPVERGPEPPASLSFDPDEWLRRQFSEDEDNQESDEHSS